MNGVAKKVHPSFLCMFSSEMVIEILLEHLKCALFLFRTTIAIWPNFASSNSPMAVKKVLFFSPPTAPIFFTINDVQRVNDCS